MILTETCPPPTHDTAHVHTASRSTRRSGAGTRRRGSRVRMRTRVRPRLVRGMIHRCGKGCCSSCRILKLFRREACLGTKEMYQNLIHIVLRRIFSYYSLATWRHSNFAYTHNKSWNIALRVYNWPIHHISSTLAWLSDGKPIEKGDSGIPPNLPRIIGIQ